MRSRGFSRESEPRDYFPGGMDSANTEAQLISRHYSAGPTGRLWIFIFIPHAECVHGIYLLLQFVSQVKTIQYCRIIRCSQLGDPITKWIIKVRHEMWRQPICCAGHSKWPVEWTIWHRERYNRQRQGIFKRNILIMHCYSESLGAPWRFGGQKYSTLREQCGENMRFWLGSLDVQKW